MHRIIRTCTFRPTRTLLLSRALSPSSSLPSPVPKPTPADPSTPAPSPAAPFAALTTPAQDQETVACISGAPEALQARSVRIYKPAKTAMQSGEHRTEHWVLAFDTEDRWENPLIGWTSSSDAMQATSLEFTTQDAAIDFAKRQGWSYRVMAPNPGLPRDTKKVYAENFVYSSTKLRLHKTK